MTVNTKLKEARKNKKMTIRGLAGLSGVSCQSIFNYENNVCNPSQVIFIKIKESLDLDGEYCDFFVRRKYNKYNKDSVCIVEGCEARPVAKDVCMKHYMSLRSKKAREKANNVE